MRRVHDLCFGASNQETGNYLERILMLGGDVDVCVWKLLDRLHFARSFYPLKAATPRFMTNRLYVLSGKGV